MAAMARFKELKAERRRRAPEPEPEPDAAEASRAAQAQRRARMAATPRLTMTPRVEGEQLDLPPPAIDLPPAQPPPQTPPSSKPQTLEERWAAEDAAAAERAAPKTPGGLAAIQPLIDAARALVGEGQLAEGRAKWEEARKAVAAAEVVAPPLNAGGKEGVVTTFIEIPAEQEMMRQMQLTALRMICVEGLASLDFRLGRWSDAVEGASSVLAIAPRDVDALLLRGRARASSNLIDDARADFERAARIGNPSQKAECEQALRQLKRASVVRGRWRPSPELEQSLEGGPAAAPPGRPAPKFALPLTIEAVSASGRKFRLFVIGNSSGPAGDVWGGLEKPDGTIVKYEGGFDADSGALALKHQDTLAEGGATHAIQGKLVQSRGAAPAERFPLEYSQWWADITQIEGGEGGREEYVWQCRLAATGARPEWSTEFTSKGSKAAVKYLEKMEDEPAPEPEPAPIPTDQPRPATLDEVFDMATRLELVTESGVAMMRRNIARGRRSESHFIKQWSARIDKELAERREAKGLAPMDRAEASKAVAAAKAREEAVTKPLDVQVAAPGEGVGVLMDEIFGGGKESNPLENDMTALLAGLREESGVFGTSSSKPTMEQRVEEARAELLGNIASRHSEGGIGLAPFRPSGDGEDADFEPEPEPEPEEEEEEEEALPRWLLRRHGSPSVRGHTLSDPEFDSLRVAPAPKVSSTSVNRAYCPWMSRLNVVRWLARRVTQRSRRVLMGWGRCWGGLSTAKGR